MDEPHLGENHGEPHLEKKASAGLGWDQNSAQFMAMQPLWEPNQSSPKYSLELGG